MWQDVNKKALAWTLGLHALLLLLLLVIKYAPPAQAAPIQEMGIEVNLGTDEDGSGNDQPMDMNAPAPETHTAQASNTQDAAEQKELMTDEREEATTPKTTKQTAKPSPIAPRKESVTLPTKTENTKPIVPNKPKYAYPGSAGAGGNNAAINKAGSGEGNGTGSGDKGVPGGTPGAKNYAGTPGTGSMGINHSIAQRRIVAYPEREAEFKDGGTVVLRITVDRTGKITGKQIKSSSSSALSSIALRKAEQIRFDQNSDAPVEQFGTITFVFKAR